MLLGTQTAVGPVQTSRANNQGTRCRGKRLDFLVPLTSKNAFGFGIRGFEIAGPYSRASYLRRRGVPYLPYVKTCPKFQTRRPFSK